MRDMMFFYCHIHKKTFLEVSALTVLETAHQTLINVMAKITIQARWESFKEEMPDHRALVKMWGRRKV